MTPKTQGRSFGNPAKTVHTSQDRRMLRRKFGENQRFLRRCVPFEPLSKLLVSPLTTPNIVPYIIPYITPFKELRL